MKYYLKLIRVKHYLKNLLIFFPLFFNGSIMDVTLIIKCLIGFISFCFISSCVYIMNDIKDAENDKKHPIKKNRPIASGIVSIKNASILIILLFLLSILIILFGIIFFDINVFAIFYLLIYFVLNILYSFVLKKIPIIDIICLACFYLIRVIYGGFVTDIDISNWLFLTVFFSSLYFGYGKRRNEIVNCNVSREVFKYYTVDFLDKNMNICLTMFLLFYFLWANEMTYPFILYSIIIVYYIVIRYNMKLDENKFDNPVDIITNDVILILCIIIYILFLGVCIYV